MIYISTKLTIHTNNNLYSIIKISINSEKDRLYKILYPKNNNFTKYYNEDTLVQYLFNYKTLYTLYTLLQIKEIYDIPNSNKSI